MRPFAFPIFLLVASSMVATETVDAKAPDLIPVKFAFSNKYPQRVGVHVICKYAPAPGSVLKLRVYHSGGGREMHVRMKPMKTNEIRKCTLDAAGILARGQRLKQLDFAVFVDSTKKVPELNEANNKLAHKLGGHKADLWPNKISLSLSKQKLYVNVKNKGGKTAKETTGLLRVWFKKGAPQSKKVAVIKLHPGQNKSVAISLKGWLTKTQMMQAKKFLFYADWTNQVQEASEANNKIGYSPKYPKSFTAR